MDTPPSLPDPSVVPLEQTSTSVWARLFNIYAEPGEVFDEIKQAPAAVANWLVPVVLWIVVGVVSSFILLSQPAVQQAIHEQQAKAMDKMVQQGKMTREQADQATAMAEKFTGPTMLKIFGSVGSIVIGFVHVFWWGLVLWLFGKWFMKSQFPYGKALEVAGLPMMIGILAAVLSVLLGVILGKMYASPSLGLMVSDFDVTNKGHFFLAAVNPFHFWQAAVMGVGLAKVSGAPVVRGVLLLLAFWVVQQSLLILSGLGQFTL